MRLSCLKSQSSGMVSKRYETFGMQLLGAAAMEHRLLPYKIVLITNFQNTSVKVPYLNVSTQLCILFS